ncbi:MAG: 50S ribosomal protein L9 [Thermoleophilia bacterium]|nr:50S ribosomal protein L9 [Thermoleophilia bacterium]
MEVILLQDVDKLGEKGQVVSASDGYVRNFLLPRKLAEVASPGRIAEVRQRQEAEETRKLKMIERAGETAGLLSRTVLTIEAQAGEDGRLFGSVTAADISKEIYRARNIKIDKKKITLADPIKETGDYMVEIEVSPGVNANTKVIVTSAK